MPVWRVDVEVTGSGAGTVSSTSSGLLCAEGSCSAEFFSGEIELRATPAEGSRFVGWSGDCSGQRGCQLDLQGNAAVNATFNRVVTVTTVASGNGSVFINYADTGCKSRGPCYHQCEGGECTDLVDVGARPTVWAYTDPQHRPPVFTGWGGDCAGTTANPCQLGPITGPVYVVAVFYGGASARFGSTVPAEPAHGSPADPFPRSPMNPNASRPAAPGGLEE